MSNNDTCVITFQAEAYDWARSAYEALISLTVEVHPAGGDPFKAELISVIEDSEDGQTYARFAPTGDPYELPDRDNLQTFNVYELDRIEVL